MARLTGTSGDDTLDAFDAQFPNTTLPYIIRGRGGADDIDGADGDDRIYGDGGADFMNGHGGDDLLWGRTGDDAMNGGQGFDVIRGGPGNDFMSTGAEGSNLYGDRGADYLVLHNGLAEGGAGPDTIQSGAFAGARWGEGGEVLVYGGRAVGDAFVFCGANDGASTNTRVVDYAAGERIGLSMHLPDGSSADGITVAGWLDANGDRVLDAADGGGVGVGADGLSLNINNDVLTLGNADNPVAWVSVDNIF
jgi:Ca2+-binding RTX toxin-like protein